MKNDETTNPTKAYRNAPRMLLWALLLALLFALTSGLSACQRPTPAPTRAPLKVGVYYWPGMYWADIAIDQGWFKQAGIEVEAVDTNADYLASFQNVVAGRLDTQSFPLYDLILNNAKGADLVMVFSNDYSNGADGIVGRAGINGLAKLKGKRVGVGKNTYQEFILAVVLQREGLSVADLTLVELPGEKAAAEMTKGTADAFVTWEPIITQALTQAHGHKLFDTSQIAGLCPYGYVFRRQLIEQRPDDVQKFVKVWQRTTEFMRQQPDDAYAIVARVNHKTVEEVREFTKLDYVLDLRDNLKAFSYAAGFESLHGTARVINDFLLKQKQISQRLDSAEFLDAQFLKTLK